MATTRRGTNGPPTRKIRGKSAVFRMPPFRRSLPMLLLWAREAVMQRFRPHVHARGLTDQQWRVIRALAEVESLEIIDLAARCCLHPASLSRILPKLAAGDIISRSANAADQRRVIVALTPGGRRLFEAAAPDSARIYAQLANDIGPEQLDQIYRVLEELIEALAEDKPKRRAQAPARRVRAGRGAARED